MTPSARFDIIDKPFSTVSGNSSSIGLFAQRQDENCDRSVRGIQFIVYIVNLKLIINQLAEQKEHYAIGIHNQLTDQAYPSITLTHSGETCDFQLHD